MALGRPSIPIQTQPGFTFVYILILLSVVLLPKQLAELVAVWNSSTGQDDIFEKRESEQHVFVGGAVTVSVLKDFLADLFRNSLSSESTEQPLKVCILLPFEEQQALETILDQPPFAEAVVTVAGSDLISSDIERADAKTAERIFLFSAAVGQSGWRKEDEVMVSRVLTLRRHCPGVPICCQVITSEARNRIVHLATWDPSVDVCICKESLKLSLMASNCQVLSIYGNNCLITSILLPTVRSQGQAHSVPTYCSPTQMETTPIPEHAKEQPRSQAGPTSTSMAGSAASATPCPPLVWSAILSSSVFCICMSSTGSV